MAATMNLILLQDVEDLGLAGDSVHVSPGFGRNYLIPRGLAAPEAPQMPQEDPPPYEPVEGIDDDIPF